MRRIRRLVAATLLLVLVAPFAQAQTSSAPDEQKLRQTLREYQAAWNQHDENAWSAFLTDDIWFTESVDYYEKQKGKDNALSLFKSNFKESDLSMDIVKIRMMPDGSATVQTKEVVSHLPKTDGKYKAVFESDPVISRWKNVGGNWKMFFYTSHKGSALDLLKKDGL
jgi:ketosteroid isomerase-like protein